MSNVVVRGLTIEHRSGPYVVRPLHNLDLDLASGSFVLLLGASGCGKTSLLSVLAGILTPQGGTVSVDGHELAALSEAELVQFRRRTVGLVFQSFNLVPSLNAWENVAVPLWSSGQRGAAARERALHLLDEVGLADRAGHRPSELSGGQQQRVAIARALAHDPPVLLADEPTAHLDAASVEEVLRVLRALARPGRLVVVATHDHRLLPVADQVVELTAGAGVAPPSEPARTDLAPGEVLFHEGDMGKLVYLVEAGTMELVRALADGGEEQLAVAGPGGYFGELAPMLQLPRAGTARAGAGGASVVGLTPDRFRRRTKDTDASGATGAASPAPTAAKRAATKRAAAKQAPRKATGTKKASTKKAAGTKKAAAKRTRG
jgi:putative ABC transport system ATP-binding protein